MTPQITTEEALRLLRSAACPARLNVALDAPAGETFGSPLDHPCPVHGAGVGERCADVCREVRP